MMTSASLAKLSAPEGAESMNRSSAPRGATVGGRQPGKPAAMSLRCGCCQSHTRPRKWPGSVAGRLYVGMGTTGVVKEQARPASRAERGLAISIPTRLGAGQYKAKDFRAGFGRGHR